MIVSVLNHKSVSQDAVIGSFEANLSDVYAKPNHALLY